MKQLFIVANWKSQKTVSEAEQWFEHLLSTYDLSPFKKVIVCPSFTSLPILKSSIVNHKSSIILGVQDVSPFSEGAYTGEVSARQVKEFADYALIGHSERREYFKETDTLLAKKVAEALALNVTPIYCVQNETQVVPQNVKLVAYEPTGAISTDGGHPDTPQNANSVAAQIKKRYSYVLVLYGGSVTEKNVHDFTSQEQIDGVLVGNQSLDAESFGAIITNA